jgi:sugar-phosphatase
MDGVLYLEVARRLGLHPEECLVVEDAVSVIQSARAAGCKCLALTTSFSAGRLIQADWICHTLEDAPEASINW